MANADRAHASRALHVLPQLAHAVDYVDVRRLALYPPDAHGHIASVERVRPYVLLRRVAAARQRTFERVVEGAQLSSIVTVLACANVIRLSRVGLYRARSDVLERRQLWRVVGVDDSDLPEVEDIRL